MRRRGGFTVMAVLATFLHSQPALAQVAVDPATLTAYTGSNWTMAVPPAWAPTTGADTVGGVLRDGVPAQVTISSAPSQASALDDATLASIAAGLEQAGLSLANQTNTMADGQPAVQLDVTGSSPSEVGRVVVWLEYGNVWTAAYAALTTDASAAGVDAFSSTLLPSLRVQAPVVIGLLATTPSSTATPSWTLALPAGWTLDADGLGAQGPLPGSGVSAALVVMASNADGAALADVAPAAMANAAAQDGGAVTDQAHIVVRGQPALQADVTYGNAQLAARWVAWIENGDVWLAGLVVQSADPAVVEPGLDLLADQLIPGLVPQ